MVSSKQAAWLHTTSFLLWESKFQLQTANKWEELHLVCGLQEQRKATVLHWVKKKAMRTSDRTQITISHLRKLCFPPKTCHNTSEKISQSKLESKLLSLPKLLLLFHCILTITRLFKRYSAKQAKHKHVGGLLNHKRSLLVIIITTVRVVSELSCS